MATTVAVGGGTCPLAVGRGATPAPPTAYDRRIGEVTTIAVALLSGGFGLSSGLLTARHQQRSAEQQRYDAIVTLLRQSYHGFLDVIREFVTLLASGREFTTEDFH